MVKENMDPSMKIAKDKLVGPISEGENKQRPEQIFPQPEDLNPDHQSTDAIERASVTP